MGQGLIRLLKAEEIECRVSVINERGLSLLLYKDARVDQRILDETFGVFGWKRSHQCIDGNLYCTVEVFNRESGEWVSKQDVGTTGHTEKEKSQASDSFKRACFNWGIGRELYSAPFIWVPAAKAGIQKKGDKYATYEHFSVSKISYNDSREIISLEVIDSNGQAVYVLNQGASSQNLGLKKDAVPQNDIREPAQVKGTGAEPSDGKKGSTKTGTRVNKNQGGISGQQEIVLMAELNRTGVALDEVLGRYGVASLSQMTPDVYKRAIAALRLSKPKTKPSGTAA